MGTSIQVMVQMLAGVLHFLVIGWALFGRNRLVSGGFRWPSMIKLFVIGGMIFSSVMNAVHGRPPSARLKHIGSYKSEKSVSGRPNQTRQDHPRKRAFP